MNTIKELYQTCKGKKVLVRFDGNISHETLEKNEKGIAMLRIERCIETIRKLSAHGAKVILATHLGDDGQRSTEELIPIFELYEVYVGFFKKLSTGLYEVIDDMEEGEILLIQNTRSLPGETENSAEAAEFFASLCEVFVNDAFSVSHRNHASVVGVAELRPSFMGEGLSLEISKISDFKNVVGNIGVVLGGNKLSTKLPLLKRFLSDSDVSYVLLGGALAHPVYEARGINIGNSLTDRNLTTDQIPTDDRIIVPALVITKNLPHQETQIKEVGSTDSIYDVSPKFVEDFAKEHFGNVSKIFWNGPLGNTPEGFTKGTIQLVQEIMNLEIPMVIGGGDTLDMLPEEIVAKKNIFVSTGGGALLDYLAEGTLVGISTIDRHLAL